MGNSRYNSPSHCIYTSKLDAELLSRQGRVVPGKNCCAPLKVLQYASATAWIEGCLCNEKFAPTVNYDERSDLATEHNDLKMGVGHAQGT